MVTVEWTETSISCSAGSDTVSYTVGVCPYNSFNVSAQTCGGRVETVAYNQSSDEDEFNATGNRVIVPVPRDSGVEHSFTVTAQTCGGRVETTSPPQLVNLTGIKAAMCTSSHAMFVIFIIQLLVMGVTFHTTICTA